MTRGTSLTFLLRQTHMPIPRFPTRQPHPKVCRQRIFLRQQSLDTTRRSRRRIYPARPTRSFSSVQPSSRANRSLAMSKLATARSPRSLGLHGRTCRTRNGSIGTTRQRLRRRNTNGDTLPTRSVPSTASREGRQRKSGRFGRQARKTRSGARKLRSYSFMVSKATSSNSPSTSLTEITSRKSSRASRHLSRRVRSPIRMQNPRKPRHRL